MTTRRLWCTVAFAFVVGGCGISPAPVDQPVPVSGTVGLPGGGSAQDYMLTLQPMDSGQPAGFPIGAGGKFSGEAVPGKYFYFLSPPEGKTATAARRAAYLALPENVRAASPERTLSVSSGATLSLRFD